MTRFIVVLVLAALLAACGSQPSADAVSTAIVLTADAQPTATFTPEPTATPIPSPTATATPEPLTPTGIFEQLSPAVVRLEADGGFGSGVLIEGNYILTNAHVVWPDETITVVMPDGPTLENVPVVGVDLLADLALLGPIETDVTPLTLAGHEALGIGAQLLLIGYPGDTTNAPRPTLTETLVSRLREQETFGITYFQVSAPVAGGQSGGIAVTMEGEVIGLTGNRITEAQYGLIASAADIQPRVAALLAGEAGPAAGRGPDAPQADERHFVHLSRADESRVFTAILEKDTDVRVTVDGAGDAVLYIVAPVADDSLFVDETRRGIETLDLTTASAGLHYLVLRQYNDGGNYELESNIVWTPYEDLDDGEQVVVGDVYEGVIDYPYDADAIDLVLDKGEVVNVHVSSLLVDPILLIQSTLLGNEATVEDDDSGGGLFDTDAELTYEAPHAGLYRLVVLDLTGGRAGGYRLEVRQPYDGAPTPTAPEPTPAPIITPFGEFKRWESVSFPFAFAYPADYDDISGTTGCPEVVYSFCLSGPRDGSFVGVLELPLDDARAAQTVEEIAASMAEDLSEDMGITFTGSEQLDSALNRPAVVLSFVAEENGLFFKVFVYKLNGDATFNLVFIYDDPALEEMINYVFSTFEVTQ